MIIVTGAKGFVGRHLVRRLVALKEKVHEIDTESGLDINTCNLPDATRVYHLAAQTNAYVTDARHDAQTNIMGSIRFFERYREKLVFASTSMVNYPKNPYAISKKACEDYAWFYGCGVVRFCNLYGKGGHSFWDICREKSEVTVYGNGEQMRTWAPVEEAVDALLDVKPGAIVVLPGVNLTLNQITEKFHNRVKYDRARGNDLQYAPQLSLS